MAGYDPKKAELYNKLKQQGLSDDQAWKQSGFTDADENNYVINDSPYNADGTKNTTRGQMGPLVIGSGTVQPALTADEKAYRASIDAAGAGFDQRLAADSANFDNTKNVERVAYPVKADSRPSTATPITYTTTSTEQISGGGSKTITAGVSTANDRSTALQAQSDAKSAELKQYLADNPRNPNATPEEQAARRAKITEISNERGKLATAAEEAKTPGNPTETTTPNTTTDTSTTTYSQSSTNSDVETTAGPDPALNQEPSRADTEVQSAEPAPVRETGNTFTDTRPPIAEPINVDDGNNSAAGIEFVQNDAPAAQQFDTPLLTPEQSIARAQGVQLDVPTDDPAAAAADFNANTSTSVLGAIGVPPPVDPAVDQSAAETDRLARGGADAADAASNESTAETARLNRNEAASVEAATKQRALEQAALQANLGQTANGDWRVRIRLAYNSNYLYKASDSTSILAPLKASDGVIFPYTPTISTSYNADYDTTDLTHSNYRGQFYKSSNVGDISINGIFTAQDTAEANYLLAVIHFFRSVTKMFYGQDAQRGSPPPLVYLSGYGPYQFNGHPCVVKTFNYSLPNDVDYIRTQPNNYGINLLNRRVATSVAPSNTIGSVIGRLSNAVDLLGNILKKGALPGGAGGTPGGQPGVAQQAVYNTSNATYVPTKIEIQLGLMPIQTRNQVSQQFSLKDYSNGSLLRGGFW